MSDVKVVDCSGKKIYIFDNLLNYSDRTHAYSTVQNSLFRIGFADTDAIENSKNKYVCSFYNEHDTKVLGILDAIKNKNPIIDETLKKSFIHTFVNMTVHNEEHFVHTHKDQWIMLYYANLDWKNEWAGETLFFNEDLTEIEYASIYKPGRIILFDGDIPHTIRNPSPGAPFFRFTVASAFKKEE